MPHPYCSVTAFVDWNSQLIHSGVDPDVFPEEAAKAAFKGVTRKIVACLSKLDPDRRFQVRLRLYHGWHKGFTPSPNRKAIMQVVAETDFATLSTKPSVVFSAEIGFGDCLLSALPIRMHAKLGIHLPNTLRERVNRGLEEKMVDTALASDLIVTAYEDPTDWILVAADDDDIVPPIFVAEAIMQRSGSRVLLLRGRKPTKNLLLLDGISV